MRNAFASRAAAGVARCAALVLMRIMRALQILIRQQVEKTRLAFVEYQRAHDAHAEAKAAAAAVESQLMASSGACTACADADTRNAHSCNTYRRLRR